MPTVPPASLAPPSSLSSTDLHARRSLRRSVERRAATVRAAVRRRRARAGGAALLGAMTLAAGAASAQDNGGASSQAHAQAAARAPGLRPGDTGPAVTALQKKLHIRADGAYGPGTRRAVRRFQRRRDLKADGIARASVLRILGVRARTASKAPRVPRVLKRIAQCESGGDPRAVSVGGRYRGKYQFSYATWRQMGGKGDPAAASEARQDRLAVKLFAAQGRAPWPHCGARV